MGNEKGASKDKLFKQFQNFAKQNQGHAVRYALGGQPLWFCEPCRLQHAPPVCENCGAKRVFEFQIQPQIIALLKSDRLDFGTACVYSCSESCDPKKSAYLREWIYVQPEPTTWRNCRRGEDPTK